MRWMVVGWVRHQYLSYVKHIGKLTLDHFVLNMLLWHALEP
jgi:hypothetical protein